MQFKPLGYSVNPAISFGATIFTALATLGLALIFGRSRARDFMELEIDELLGRDKVDPDQILLNKNIINQTVIVTGAGGSIGSQLCKEILRIKPKKLLILDSNEYSLYKLLNELNTINKSEDIQIFPIICSIQDKKNLNLN